MIQPTNNSSFNRAQVLLQNDWNYEATVMRVEDIISQIEAGELELEEVFERFAMAVEDLHQCEVLLQDRQQQMDLLIETLTDRSLYEMRGSTYS
jgi:exodeoxyribonuclease VII small subunit